MATRTAICPVGDHEFTYEVRQGTRRVYCSDEHQHKAAARRQKERNSGASERWCPHCEKSLPATDFSGPTAPYCKPGMAARTKEYRRQIGTVRVSAVNRGQYLRRYGLTPESFAAKLAAQGGRCAICRTDDPGPSGWQLDHDHSCCKRAKYSCGKCLRDILCTHCNKAIGELREDPVIIQAACNYVVAWRARRGALAGHRGVAASG